MIEFLYKGQKCYTNNLPKKLTAMLNKELEKAVDEELYKDCKCNNCVWAYKEARFCPLGRCIQGNK